MTGSQEFQARLLFISSVQVAGSLTGRRDAFDPFSLTLIVAAGSSSECWTQSEGRVTGSARAAQ